MSSPSQARAVQDYRKRLSQRGMARFEVVVLEKDRELVRAVARRLAENTREAEEMRAAMKQEVSGAQSKKSSILSLLQSWPLAELDLTRPFEEGRKIDL